LEDGKVDEDDAGEQNGADGDPEDRAMRASVAAWTRRLLQRDGATSNGDGRE